MKQTLNVLLGLMMSCLTLVASDIIPLEGKEWIVETQIFYPGSPITTHRMWIEGDTTVSNKTCKKLHIVSYSEDEQTDYAIEYCRQEGGKFYKNDVLMFDFGLKKGDIFTIGEGTQVIVTDIGDTVLTDNTLRRCLTVNYFHPEWDMIANSSDKWIEGIGSLEMGILDNAFMNGGLKKTLRRCLHNGVIIYDKNGVSQTELHKIELVKCNICILGSAFLCASPTATRFEVYTMDAIKVGETAFANGEATVKVDKVPATYLYIVTYPDGRRESGKVAVK